MPTDADATTISLAGFSFDPATLELRDSTGAAIALRVKSLAVLRCLAERRGRVVDRDTLMRTVWPRVVVTDDSLARCISEIRHALHDDSHRIVQTESKRGYRLAAEEPRGAERPAPPAAHLQQEVRFATGAGGVQLAYGASGDGPPLVRAAHWVPHLEWELRSLTHGPWAQRLSSRYRYLRYDARGCGLSDRTAAATTIDEWVADMAAVVDADGLERFAVFGLSGGGAITIRYAALHPERVSHLVIIGGFARGALHRGAGGMSAQMLDAMARLIEEGWGQDTPAFRQLITSLMFPRASAEQMDSFNQLQRASSTPQMAAHFLRVIADFDVSADLPNVRCPTLVLHSAGEARVPFEEGRLVASMIPKAPLLALDSTNHMPLEGEPAFDEAHRLIDEFLLG